MQYILASYLFFFKKNKNKGRLKSGRPSSHSPAEVLIYLKTSDWLRIIVANTLPLETNLANGIGTDVEVLTNVLTTIQGSSSVIKDYKIRQGN